MIGINGQYLFKFKLGDESDFIREEDLHNFRLIEDAGNVLPSFQIGFDTDNENILGLLNETNKFEVSFGKDLKDDYITAPLSVATKSSNKKGNSKLEITAGGLYSALPYIQDSRQSISGKKSAIEVIKEKVTPHFSFPDINVQKSLDSQIWIQPNTSDKKFINELWLHADLGTSFPAIGITSGGEFLIKDMVKEGTKPFLWKFTHNPKKATDLQYDGDYSVNDQTGFINSWVGYGREKTVYDIESGAVAQICEISEPVVALTNKLARLAEIEKRFTSTGVSNENTHANYWKSALHNLTNLASLSASAITLSFQNQFVPIKLLDQVMFTDEDVGNNSQSSALTSGLYFVSKVSRNLGNRQFSTVVILTRESLNEIKTV